MFLDVQYYPPMESARFWLNEEMLKLPAGMAQRYQTIAERGQYFANLAEKLNVTPAELDQHLINHSISEAEHNALLHLTEASGERPPMELLLAA